jgi:hypothetical protein
VNNILPHLPPFEIKPSHVPSAFVVAQGEETVANKLIITGKDAGRELRRAIAAYVEDLEPSGVCVLDIDLSGVLMLDVAVAFELNKARVGVQLMEDGIGCYLVLRGVSVQLRETLRALMRYLETVWVIYLDGSDTPEILGELSRELRETWEFAVERGSLDASAFDEIAEKSGNKIAASARSNRLTSLSQLHLLVKAAESGIETPTGDLSAQRSGRSRMFFPVC